MKGIYEAKPLPYRELKGLSERQLMEHHDVLYVGYVNKLAEIRDKLMKTSRTDANATYSEIRALKHEESFALDAVKLHEAYFASLGGAGGSPDGNARKLIDEDFGSFEKWLEDFKAAGIAARGWVILAFDLDDDMVHNYSCDVHNQGGIWNAIPLLVLDVYEHAYFIDYGTNRKAYVDAFTQNINWEYVNSLIAKFDLVKRRLARAA